MQQSPPSAAAAAVAQFGMVPSGGADARLVANLHDWLVLQHRHQQQMHYLSALKQQQQQQQHGLLTSPGAHQLASPHHHHHFDAASLRQHLHLSQLQQQHVPPMPPVHGTIPNCATAAAAADGGDTVGRRQTSAVVGVLQSRTDPGVA